MGSILIESEGWWFDIEGLRISGAFMRLAPSWQGDRPTAAVLRPANIEIYTGSLERHSTLLLFLRAFEQSRSSVAF
jgi:hypothetical protein